MAESSTITREMIEAGARAYDRDTLRKAGWTQSTIAEMMEGREPSPSSLEASELILRAALAPCVAARPALRADGCRSAFAPCAHQKDDPTTLCGSCQRAAADRDFDEDMMPGGFN